MQATSLYRAAQAAQAVERYQQAALTVTPNYVYVAVVDDVTCEHCLGHEREVFTIDEVMAYFPDYTGAVGGFELHPNVHVTLWNRDTCRCRLFLYADPTATRMDDVETPDKLSDKEYDDYLSALLAGLYITSEVYDAIMARRKKKKQEENKNANP